MACTAPGIDRKKLWGLMREIKAVEKAIGRKATFGELLPFFEEWHRISEPFLDPEKTRDHVSTAILAPHCPQAPITLIMAAFPRRVF